MIGKMRIPILLHEEINDQEKEEIHGSPNKWRPRTSDAAQR
jgi:hypothetical protein